MIFPQHRVVAQLIKDADLTPDQAVEVARAMAGLQGTIAPEDFFLLGQDIAFGGGSLGPSAGNVSEIGIAITDVTRPTQFTLERVITNVDCNLSIILPTDLAAFGASNARLRDVNAQFVKPTAPLLAPRASVISATPAAFVGQFVAPLAAIASSVQLDFVCREGWGIAVSTSAVNTLLRAFFMWREKDLRLR